KGKVLINTAGLLAATDPIDNTPNLRGKNARMKAHPIQLQAGKIYVISMNSNAVDSYLRLENAVGQTVAEDDDSGGFPNARIIYRPVQSGVFKIVATAYDGKLGPYQLTVQEAEVSGGPPKVGGDPPPNVASASWT